VGLEEYTPGMWLLHLTLLPFAQPSFGKCLFLPSERLIYCMQQEKEEEEEDGTSGERSGAALAHTHVRVTSFPLQTLIWSISGLPGKGQSTPKKKTTIGPRCAFGRRKHQAAGPVNRGPIVPGQRSGLTSPGQMSRLCVVIDLI